jgi:hypothetical protein
MVDMTLGCNPAESDAVDLTVVADPSLSIAVYSNESICVGGTSIVSSNLSNGTGTPTYTWQFFDGSDWNDVVNGTPTGTTYDNQSSLSLTINTNNSSTPTGSYMYKALVVMTGSGCSSAESAPAAYNVVADPVSQIISETPDAGITMCSGGLVSAQFSGGSGGVINVTDNYEYSVNGGTDWLSYTPGEDVASNDVGNDQMRIRTFRTADGNGCDDSTPNVVQWNVVEQPIPPSATRHPLIETVCQDQELYISDVNDEGGGTGVCEDLVYRWTNNSGSTWSAWSTDIPDPFLSVFDEANIIQIKKSCDGHGCVDGIAHFQWDALDEIELITPTFSYQVVCTEGPTVITTAIVGSEGQDSPEWQYLDPNTLTWSIVQDNIPTGAIYEDENTLNMGIAGITEIGEYYYRAYLFIPGSGCEETVSEPSMLRVIEQPSSPDFAEMSPINAVVCDGETLTISSQASGGQNTGLTCEYLYRYYDGEFSEPSSDIPTFIAVTGDNYIQARRVNCQTGCEDTGWQTIASWIVKEQPTVSIINSHYVACNGDELVYFLNIDEGTGTHYFQWQSSADGENWSDIIGETNSSYNVNTDVSGTFHYRIKYQMAGNACDLAFDSRELTIEDFPVVADPQINDYVWIGNINNNWFNPGNWRVFDGANFVNASLAPKSDNNVYLIDQNSCVSNTQVVVPNIDAIFNDIFIDDGFELIIQE